MSTSIENIVRLLEHATSKLVAPKDPDPLGASSSEVDEARFEKVQLAANCWAARDDAIVLAITDLLSLSEQHHFEQEVTAKGLFGTVVKRYSTPTTASLGCLVLPFLFPDLPSFMHVAALILHLRSLDAQPRSAGPDGDLLATNPPEMWMTLYLLSTRLPDRFATARDHFLTVNHMSLTIHLFEKKLTTVEDLAHSLAAASSAVLPPIFEGCAPSFLASSVDSASVAIAFEVAAVAFGNKGGKKSGKKGGGGGSGGGGGGGRVEVVEGWVVEVVEGAVVGGAAGVVVAVAEGVGVVVEVEVVEEEVVGRPSSSSPSSSSTTSSSSSHSSSSSSSSSRASASKPSSSSGGRLDQGALSATAAHPAGRRVARSSTPLPVLGADWAEQRRHLWPFHPAARVACTSLTTQSASLSFSLDSGASSCFFRDHTDLTSLRTPVTTTMAGPSVGAVVAHSTTTLPCPAAPSWVLTGYYTPSFSRKLVGVSHIDDLGVVTTFPLDESVASCTDDVTGAPLATFPREPGSGLPESLAPLPRSPAPLCTPCVEGWQRAAPHSSSFPPTTAPFQTLHLDVWGPSLVLGPRQERYFLIVVDDYSRYTTVFPL
ncbi:unnamed protein product [Closterium sp. NIES-54]